MLDLETLRIVQASVGALTFVLVYFGTYRSTRAAYARWWSLVVVFSTVSSTLYLLDTGAGVPVADALGNALAVLSGGMAWAAARSLRGLTVSALQLAVVPAVIAVATLLSPRSDAVVAGTGFLVAGMAAQFGLAARRLWILRSEQEGAETGDPRAGIRAALSSVALAASVLAGFYAIRAVAYVALGPESKAYTVWAGPDATTVVVMLAMVTVTYSVTEISRFEVAEAWRRRAERDDLTGLLTRDPFLRQGAVALAATPGAPTSVMLADFDRFKELNDTFGHAEGDAALVAFAAACREVLGPDALACRWGGEEFAAVLEGVDAEAAVAVAGEARPPDGGPCGRCPGGHHGELWARGGLAGEALVDVLERADEALYLAKAAGRDRAVVHGEEPASS
ncbi:GGDEF domain-containing protein [Demequina litorisediminis]|uniref:GGDEF domain-containing protein n=1 Tax=Demequina litorisediminis TaxID=1849022 RepID=A0ABQ6ICJ1_9MICO|nr:GGDEF domain-containing protein [Demequina litorisediminis]GMA34717.1 hypothetical protein GCM10025876_09210 [Demequina litorisediminis]